MRVNHNAIVIGTAILGIVSLFLLYIFGILNNGIMYGVVLLIGIMMSLTALHAIIYSKVVQGWPRIDIKLSNISIQSKEQVYSPGLNQVYYYPCLQYEYVFGNTKYRNDAISWISMMFKFYKKQSAEEQAENLSKITKAYVNPRNPRESYLLANVHFKYLQHYFAIAIVGVLMVLVIVATILVGSS